MTAKNAVLALDQSRAIVAAFGGICSGQRTGDDRQQLHYTVQGGGKRIGANDFPGLMNFVWRSCVWVTPLLIASCTFPTCPELINVAFCMNNASEPTRF